MPAADTRPDPELQILAHNIRRLREQRKLSRREFAERIGATVRQVEHWENSESTPCLNHLRTMASFFNMTVDTLLLDSGSALDISARQIVHGVAMLTRVTAGPAAGKTEMVIRMLEDVVVEQRTHLPDDPVPRPEEGWVALDPHDLET
jgi:transcriptional regulator with XRE-family HTH domain